MSENFNLKVSPFVIFYVRRKRVRLSQTHQRVMRSAVLINFAFGDNVNRWDWVEFDAQRINLKIITGFSAAKDGFGYLRGWIFPVFHTGYCIKYETKRQI